MSSRGTAIRKAAAKWTQFMLGQGRNPANALRVIRQACRPATNHAALPLVTLVCSWSAICAATLFSTAFADTTEKSSIELAVQYQQSSNAQSKTDVRLPRSAGGWKAANTARLRRDATSQTAAGSKSPSESASRSDTPSRTASRKIQPEQNDKIAKAAYQQGQPPMRLDLNAPPFPVEMQSSDADDEPLPLPSVEQDQVSQDQGRDAHANEWQMADDEAPTVVQQTFPQSAELTRTVDANEVINIPFRDADTVVNRRDLELRMNNGLITLFANQASLSDILSILAQDHGLNVVSSDTITQKITVTLRDVPLADALNAILSIQGLSWSRRNNIISVTKVSPDQAGGAIVQGKIIRVYPLSYVTGTEVESVVKDLLSPVGKVRSMQSEKQDSRRSSDRLIVEDLPDYLDRIDTCINQLDRPPRQVQIEAHILEVDLSAENRHGVNLEMLSDVAGTSVSLKTPGFAKSSSNPALLVGIDGSKVDGLVEALKNTVDARTLASPQVMVTHGQEAKIQIGGKIGYRQSTTTETSTVQGVEFLDVGVVLTVTPYIGANGQVLMKVNPEVSDGSINIDTELPDEQITTVDSTVLLNDGQGMVIGGLIREVDDDQRIKAAGLGELWMVGRLFQQSRKKRSRTEVIVVLVPRIIECPCPIDAEQQIQLDRANTPLFHGALEREYRPWEPELPEVRYRPRDTRRNAQEFRRSEGVRWIPEAPRSGEFYLPEPGVDVPVMMEAMPMEVPKGTPVPIQDSPEAAQDPAAANKSSVPRLRADRIPVEATSARNAVSPASTRPQAAKTESFSPGKSSQNRSVRGIQTFHRPN